jgi:hypothetical protein
MTYFLLHDELELALEPLEQDVCLHALASTAYSALGHASAKRCLDGAVPAWLISKRLPCWKPELIERAAKALVSVGLWEAREDGYVFVDWDLHQFTKAQEAARKAKQNARQRKRRAMSAGLVNIAENENVTRDEARDVTAPLALALASPSPKENSEEEERETAPASPPPAPKLSKAKEPKKRDQDKELFRKTVRDEASKLGLIEFSIPSKYVDQVLAKAKGNAEANRLTLETSIRQVAREGIQRQLKAGKEPKWGLVDWQPYAVVRDLRKPMPCAPRSAFSTLSIEEQAKAQGATGWF